MFTYDLAIIGAGSGGLTAARTATRFGASVALLEHDKIGGDCLHTGCVPSKSLINIARKIDSLRKTARFMPGLNTVKSELKFSNIVESIKLSQKIIEDRSDNTTTLSRQGIAVIKGTFAFKDTHTLISGEGQAVKFKRCVIASGSRPRIPEISGTEGIPYLTSDSVWGLEKLPKTMAFIGGGPIGLELGQAFAMLGCKVTVFERSDRLVGRFDKSVSDALQKGLEDAGVQLIFNSSIESVAASNQSVVVRYKQSSVQSNLAAEKLFIATGRTPNTAYLGLGTVGIKLNDHGGIIVDKKLRTSAKNIYAVGDCLGGPLFTHWAAEQGASAVLHALFGIAHAVDSSALPSATFTTPEIGQVGPAEQELISKKINYRTLELPYANIDKAVAEEEDGFINIFVDSRRRVLGANIVGHNAAELIGYFSYLVGRKLKLDELAGSIQPYPTYIMALKELAADHKLTAFNHSLASRILRKIRG
jgi:pyruvate/2-oxoglutarate dehydrogenase complex dihydrolipoamide dehydrogenase (E3) component